MSDREWGSRFMLGSGGLDLCWTGSRGIDLSWTGSRGLDLC